ncbi:MAG: aminopeptidase N, partial [Rhodanobacteraceae bacterium]
MDTSTPPAIETITRLADYQPPAWRVTEVQLRFELGVDETRVRSRLVLARDRDEPLRLDGEDVELVSAWLDGRVLATADYTLEAAGLTVAGAQDGSVLELDVRIDPTRNTQLCGLYLSGSREHGFLLTQCEAQGFRRITFSPD